MAFLMNLRGVVAATALALAAQPALSQDNAALTTAGDVRAEI